MTLGGILEFFLGNTFSFVVFCSFGMSLSLFVAKWKYLNELIAKGGFWFTLGSTLTPAFNAFNTYATDEHGLLDPDFRASFGEFSSEPSFIDLTQALCSLLPPLHGFNEPPLSHMRTEDQYYLRRHLFRIIHDICASRRGVLAICNRKHGDCVKPAESEFLRARKLRRL